MNVSSTSPPAGSGSRPACLIVFKFESRWNHHLIRKLSLAFAVSHVYADDIFRDGGSSRLTSHLNRLVAEIDPEIVVFDIDYYPPLDIELIESVARARTKIAVTFDDLVLHDLNSITASACDLVLSADPLSVLRYREKAIPAEYMPLEGSAELYSDQKIPRDIDILHFGVLDKADRREYVDYLVSKGMLISLYGVGREYVPIEQLSTYISRAKIVVNFSKTDYLNVLDFGIRHAHPYYLQLKGRVIEAGLCGAACVSEYAPGLQLLFSEDEVPSFKTKEECHALLARLLGDEAARHACANRLSGKVAREFEDGVCMQRIAKSISALPVSRRPLAEVPAAYWRSVARGKLARIATNPVLVLRELCFLVSIGRVGSFPLRLLLMMEMAVWIPWHLTGRAVKRLAGNS